MSYRSGDQGYYSAERTGGYGAYQPSSARSDSSPPLPRYLSLGVVALGLASYLVSYGPVLGLADIGWGVRFAVLAALLAAFGLAPGQTPNAKVIAALAAAGFLDALSTLITAPDGSRPGWALTVIVVLNGLQAVAAVAALMLQAGVVGQRASQSEYDAYADYYAQAAQYYGQYAQQQPQPDELRRAGTAQAQQTHQAAARQSQQAPASQAGSYAEYVGNYGTDATHGRAPAHPDQQAAPTGPQAGLPSFGQAQAPAQQQGGGAHAEHRPTAPQ
ncbi:DUF5336 domain-containing protein [Mycobacterium talmoniae]|uniref:34 kDa antigenic protein n=1 Tax=Mycobacterium talmoniae TaxID=1858794 RepID=A0A1S1NCI1_9MYCO|nr:MULTISPECIES: DUF5336 domain-containing protein [Mycobacterium]OHV02781.1 hypothetical protein BKN37_15675 [Mycobacterium talmoniae]TDH48801.1 hypothetical protein E2F47_22500 [Mycobacterium eburneum]